MLSDLSTIIVRGGAVRRRDDRHVSPYPDVSATHGAAHLHRKAPHRHKHKGVSASEVLSGSRGGQPQPVFDVGACGATCPPILLQAKRTLSRLDKTM